MVSIQNDDGCNEQTKLGYQYQMNHFFFFAVPSQICAQAEKTNIERWNEKIKKITQFWQT